MGQLWAKNFPAALSHTYQEFLTPCKNLEKLFHDF